MAVGATAILKPAEQTPLTATILARLATEAGVPAGVLNVVSGPGSATGAALVANPSVDHVTFTGSVRTGKSVMKAVAEHNASLTLELGGKNPIVVMPDADTDSALQGVERGIFTNCGQVCSAGSRLLLHRKVADEFLEGIAMFVDKRLHRLNGRPNSASAKRANAFLGISLARRSSRTSLSSALIRSLSSLVD